MTADFIIYRSIPQVGHRNEQKKRPRCETDKFLCIFHQFNFVLMFSRRALLRYHLSGRRIARSQAIVSDEQSKSFRQTKAKCVICVSKFIQTLSMRTVRIPFKPQLMWNESSMWCACIIIANTLTRTRNAIRVAVNVAVVMTGVVKLSQRYRLGKDDNSVRQKQLAHQSHARLSQQIAWIALRCSCEWLFYAFGNVCVCCVCESVRQQQYASIADIHFTVARLVAALNWYRSHRKKDCSHIRPDIRSNHQFLFDIFCVVHKTASYPDSHP